MRLPIFNVFNININDKMNCHLKISNEINYYNIINIYIFMQLHGKYIINLMQLKNDCIDLQVVNYI